MAYAYLFKYIIIGDTGSFAQLARLDFILRAVLRCRQIVSITAIH